MMWMWKNNGNMCVREKERASQENVAVCLESRPRDTEKGRTLVWPTFPHCDLVTATSHVGMRRGLRLAAGQHARWTGAQSASPHVFVFLLFVHSTCLSNPSDLSKPYICALPWLEDLAAWRPLGINSAIPRMCGVSGLHLTTILYLHP